MLTAQRTQLTRRARGLTPDPATALGRCVRRLPTLRGIGPIGAWVLSTEIFGWRQIRNARQLGGLVGLVPAPYQSGENGPRFRHYSRGQQTRATFDGGARVGVAPLSADECVVPVVSAEVWRRSRRLRRIGIVALARKLLIALWRYGEHGVIPEGPW